MPYAPMGIPRAGSEGKEEMQFASRQRRATEAYEGYAARSDEAGGRKMRQRCEQLRKILLSILLGSTMSVALATGGIDWSGFGRVYHKSWNFESFVASGDEIERTREKMDLYLMGSKALGDNLVANFRFLHENHDFYDEMNPFGLDRAYLQWNYGGKGNFISVGKVGKMYKFVGDHLRGESIGLFGVTWLHNMPLGEWNVFWGASYFRLDDDSDDEDDADYILPQFGIEMDGPIKVMAGISYHLYGDTDEENATNGDTVDKMAGDLGDTAGLEFFGQISGMMGDIGWELMASHYTNEDAPEGKEDTATYYGVGLSWMDFSLSWAMQSTAWNSVNTSIIDEDWCGMAPKSVLMEPNFYNEESLYQSTPCKGMSVTLQYKLSDHIMPSFTWRESEWDWREEIETTFSMIRFSLDFVF